MNNDNNHRIGAKFASTAVLTLALIAPSALFAGPVTFADGGGFSRTDDHGEFARRVDRAVDLIREQALEMPTCQAYFARLGVDLEAWLAPNRPPYVKPKSLNVAFSRRSAEPVCGGAQGRPPFEFLFVDKSCFRGRDVCALASLILHELGHLARRDTRDNEPPEFFVACRLSLCVDPARYD